MDSLHLQECAVTLAAKKKHKSSVDMFISRKALQAFLQIDIKHLMDGVPADS